MTTKVKTETISDQLKGHTEGGANLLSWLDAFAASDENKMHRYKDAVDAPCSFDEEAIAYLEARLEELQEAMDAAEGVDADAYQDAVDDWCDLSAELDTVSGCDCLVQAEEVYGVGGIVGAIEDYLLDAIVYSGMSISGQDLGQTITIDITVGGPGIWAELDDEGSGYVNGAWGSDRAQYFGRWSHLAEVILELA